MSVPASSTAMWRIKRASPVSVSTSTTATWAPNGNVPPSAVKSVSAVQRSLLGSCKIGPADVVCRRPNDVEATGRDVEHDVVDGGLEQASRPLACLLDQLVGRDGDRRATLSAPSATRL